MNVSPAGFGTVEVNQVTPLDFPYHGTFENGTTVSLKAIPAPGYSFDGWSGAISSTDNPVTLVMNCIKGVTANFSPTGYILTLQVTGNGISTPQEGTHTYSQGALVSIEAIPDTGWQFDGWSGDVDDTSSAITTVTIDSDKIVTAKFSRAMHTLTIYINGNGSTTPAAGKHSYKDGTVVEITATPDSGWRFVGWSGDADDARSAKIEANLDSDKNLKANFSPIEHILTVQVDGNGTTMPQEGTHIYNEGTRVSIEAVPDTGWQFDGWTGDVDDASSAVTTVTLAANKIVTAKFSQINSSRWLITGIIAGVIVIGLIIWMATRRRTA